MTQVVQSEHKGRCWHACLCLLGSITFFLLSIYYCKFSN